MALMYLIFTQEYFSIKVINSLMVLCILKLLMMLRLEYIAGVGGFCSVSVPNKMDAKS